MGWCTAWCKILLFCVKTIMKESHNFELARLKKKERKNFVCLVTFWFGTFAMLFRAAGRVVGHEVLENKWYIVIKGYKLTIFEV